MVLEVINGLLRPMGMEIRKTSGVFRSQNNGYTLYNYVKRDGSFDYERYRQIQTAGNKRKIHKTWAREENIAFISEYIRKTVPEPKFGICHGTRRGKEQEWFQKHLDCEVIGTEISDTAEQFPHTIQWDFHDAKPEWINAVDFIYSNALDHSYDPEKCLDTWMSCLKPHGICILEHGQMHKEEHSTELDPFGASLIQMPYLITIWGKGRYGVRQIMDAPATKNESFFIVIQRFQPILPAFQQACDGDIEQGTSLQPAQDSR